MFQSEGNNLRSKVMFEALQTSFLESVSLILVYVYACCSEKVLEKTFVTLHAYLLVNVVSYTYSLWNVVINGVQF
jgi:hypothetical protein